MSDVVEKEIEDTSSEHSFHQRFYNSCSECFKEHRATIETRKRAREQLGTPTKTTRDFLEDFRLSPNPLDL